MADKKLNQVLFHEDSRVGADLYAWLESFGGQGLLNAQSQPVPPVSRGCWADAGLMPPCSPAAPSCPHLLTSWSRRRLRRLVSRVVTLNTLAITR